MPCEKYSVEWCKRQKFPTVNMVALLREREIGSRRPGSHFVKGSREFYFTVPIVRSVHSKNRPIFYPLRFTPDGTKFIGISLNLQDVLIFDYVGVQAAMSTPADQLFSTLFPRCKTVRFWHISSSQQQSQERLTYGAVLRDSCLITPDSKHLIVCSSILVPDSNSRISGGVQKNNESLPPGNNLEDVKFYSIDLMKGEIIDQIRFDFDLIKIVQGVYLLERTLAILSVQHQTVHLFHIDRNTGAFISVLQIGRTVLDNDRLYLGGATENAITERCLMGFRQRFLSYLYKENRAIGKETAFLRNIFYYRSLKMHKIQLLGPDLILIRMDLNVSNFEMSSNASNNSSVSYVFVLLKWRTGTIVGVFHRSCEKLFKLLENFNDFFRAGSSGGLSNHFPTSMEHCGHVKNHYEYVKSTFTSCTPAEIRRQFLNFLPYSCVEVPSNTPYLDPHMFSFDERALLNIERGRLLISQPLRIFSRRSNLLHVEMEFQNNIKHHPYARLIFHPYDPFAISVNKNQPDPMTTFHIPKGYLR